MAGANLKGKPLPMPSINDQPKKAGKITMRDIIGPGPKGSMEKKQALFNQVQGKP